MVTIDEYPTMSLAQARAERARLRSLLQGGANPSQLVRAERAVQMKCMNATFDVLAAELLKKCAKEGLKSVSIKLARRTPEKDAEVAADAPRDMSTRRSVSDAVTTVNIEPHPLPDTGYLRLHQIIGRPARNGRPAIAAIIPVSRSTWWGGVKTGRYPQPVRRLGRRITAWRVEDVLALIEPAEAAIRALEKQRA